MKRLIFLIITVILLTSTISCSVVTETPEPSPTQPLSTKTPTAEPTPARTALETADVIIKALKAKDMETVAAFVHPQWGLRFTPYPFVRDGDRVFSAQAVPALFEDETIYTWGTFDGSGESIEMTFSEYYDRFVYSQDFATPEVIGLNKEIGHGNSINNIPKYYPGAEYVEYHFTGFDPQYEGMDWQSLRLVLKQENGIYYLVGIVHAEWTI